MLSGSITSVHAQLMLVSQPCCTRFCRAAIEEDYARRLAKLARQPLGRDETGYGDCAPLWS